MVTSCSPRPMRAVQRARVVGDDLEYGEALDGQPGGPRASHTPCCPDNLAQHHHRGPPTSPLRGYRTLHSADLLGSKPHCLFPLPIMHGVNASDHPFGGFGLTPSSASPSPLWRSMSWSINCPSNWPLHPLCLLLGAVLGQFHPRLPRQFQQPVCIGHYLQLCCPVSSAAAMPVRWSWCFTDWTAGCPDNMRDASLLPSRRRPVRAFSEAATRPPQLLPYRFPVQTYRQNHRPALNC